MFLSFSDEDMDTSNSQGCWSAEIWVIYWAVGILYLWGLKYVPQES